VSPQDSAQRIDTVQHLLREARSALRRAPFEAEPREAALLLGHVLGWNEAKVLAYPEVEVARADCLRFRGLMGRRLDATPVAYLLGQREFWGRPFDVDPRVLIPRPETEHLVEVVLDLDLGTAPMILEVGTGSGCLAVTLALEIPGATVVATDLSPASLAVARRNVSAHGARDHVHLVATDLLAALRSQTFDLIVSNPPYVARSEAPTLSPEVRDHEPGIALFGEGDGTGTIARLLREARGRPFLAMEIGAGQEATIQELASTAGWQARKTVRDLAGIVRTLLFSSPT
jgi:release factor glutamine methyltransferase